MNWPFKVHKLEPSVMPVCETRREGGGGRAVSGCYRGGEEHCESHGEKIRQTAESEKRRDK